MKIVIDTNVIVSSIFFGGVPRQIIDLLMIHKIDVYVSKEIVKEYQETVEYLKGKYAGRELIIPLDSIISACNMIELKSGIKASRDPDDDKFINCAVDCNALY